jgi:proteasome lid subunit RPN8/RPN11
MATQIPQVMIQRMYDQLQSAYPNEGGGLLIGHITPTHIEVVDIVEAANTFPTEEQFHRMGLAPAFWAEVEDSADERGLQIVGFYHSHPDHPAEPSQYDLAHAFPNLAYVIVSVKQGAVDHIKNWQLRENRTQFDPDSLMIV